MKKGVVARIKDQTNLNIPLNQGTIQRKFLSLFSSMLCVLSHFSCVQLFVTLWIVAH